MTDHHPDVVTAVDVAYRVHTGSVGANNAAVLMTEQFICRYFKGRGGGVTRESVNAVVAAWIDYVECVEFDDGPAWQAVLKAVADMEG